MIDLTGQTFGRLKILYRHKENARNRGAQWVCLCSCGTERVVHGGSLRSGNTKSCGCLSPDRNREVFTLPPGEASLRARYATYRRTAKLKGHLFEISKEEFDRLTKRECVYCGHDGVNGIDRVDNTKGYVRGNVVSCCRQCNTAKGTGSVTDFFEWIRRVAKRIEK
jgi:hypothetical protein